MSDLESGKRTASVDVDLTGYQLIAPTAPFKQANDTEPLGLWLDGDGKVTTDPGRAVPPSARVAVRAAPHRADAQPEPLRSPAPVYTRTNTLAVLAFVFSLFGSAVLAVILGHVALKHISATGEKGYGLAVAGTLIGYFSTAVVVVIVIVGIVEAALT